MFASSRGTVTRTLIRCQIERTVSTRRRKLAVCDNVMRFSVPAKSGTDCGSALWRAAAQVPERILPVRDLALGPTGKTAPDDGFVLGHAGLDPAIVAFAALEAHGTTVVLGATEVKRMGDNGRHEICHLSSRAARGSNAALGVEVVGQVDHVHGNAG